MLRHRKQNDLYGKTLPSEKEQTLVSEKEQLIDESGSRLRLSMYDMDEVETKVEKEIEDKTAQNVNIKEMQMIEQWEPLKKELVEAELILVPRPGTGFKRYKEHLWPDNVRVFGKPKNNGVIVKVYFERMDEYLFWRKWRKESSFMDDVFFAFSKLPI